MGNCDELNDNKRTALIVTLLRFLLWPPLLNRTSDTCCKTMRDHVQWRWSRMGSGNMHDI
jgi:hypothetical protein